MFIPKEKGQTLLSYVLILVLVAIFVIAMLMILGPVIGNVFSQVDRKLSISIVNSEVNRSLMEMAPTLDYGPTNPFSLSGSSNQHEYVPVEVGCETYPSYGNNVKIGTSYQHPEEITAVVLSPKEFEICSNAVGATVHMVIVLIEPLK
jgi:Flp pilus assembly pilin Flp